MVNPMGDFVHEMLPVVTSLYIAKYNKAHIDHKDYLDNPVGDNI